VIVLDTHALVWWVSDPERVPPAASRFINAAIEAGDRIFVSSVSIWEIAMLVARKRLVLTIDAGIWLARVEALSFLTFVPVDNRIAVRAVELEDFPHGDPADRMIAATASELGATLVTADARLQSYPRLESVWE
jgi:PIN domain nuclease of toxin-antitoxin system